MAQSFRVRILRTPKREKEVHFSTNSSNRNDSSTLSPLISRSEATSKPSLPSKNNRERLIRDDYEAPSSANSLRPNSRWLIVRRNLHRIRFMGYSEGGQTDKLPDLYLGFQMKRELKRAQDEIKNIDREKNFHVVKRFALAVDNKRTKIYNTSHVKPEDALIYDRLGEEPLALQNLLYYFSQQEVPHGTIFWDFLNEVNHVLNLRRKRTVLVKRLRKLALTLAIVVYCIIGFMFLLLIISVITTATKMNDSEVTWIEADTDKDFGKFLT